MKWQRYDIYLRTQNVLGCIWYPVWVVAMVNNVNIVVQSDTRCYYVVTLFSNSRKYGRSNSNASSKVSRIMPLWSAFVIEGIFMISSNLVDSLSQCKNTRPLIYDCCIIKRDHPKTTEKWNCQKIKEKLVKIKQKYQQ